MNDKKKVITIAALIISIIGLSIGFAAFSSSLSINSRASVDPVNNFSVKFSKVNDALNEEDVSPNNELGTNGQIDNKDNPTISNLNANFTSPGQSVEYTFYARNMGPHIAYLTDVVFNNISGKNKFKSCEPTGENPASMKLLNDACDDIKVTVKIGNNQEIVLDNTMTKGEIETAIGSNHTIQSSSTPESGTTNSEMVKVTIMYQDNGNYADGDFTVTFGDISMTYATLAGYKGETQGQDLAQACEYDESDAVNPFTSTCTLSQDNDSSGTVTKGDKVTCGTESFYVIENPSNETVKMLTEWNLNVSEPGDIEDMDGVPYSYTYCASTVGYQDEHVRGSLDTETHPELVQYAYSLTIPGVIENYPYPYGTVKFDRVTTGEYGYWAPGGSLNTSTYTDNNSGSYPAYVYDNNSTLKTFVDTYVGYLNSSVSGANASGRLINTSELEALGCSMSGWTCSSAPAWVYQTSYWSGSANNNNLVWSVGSLGYFSYNYFDNYSSYGVRPVIEISSSVIQAS